MVTCLKDVGCTDFAVLGHPRGKLPWLVRAIGPAEHVRDSGLPKPRLARLVRPPFQKYPNLKRTKKCLMLTLLNKMLRNNSLLVNLQPLRGEIGVGLRKLRKAGPQALSLVF